MKCKEKEEIDPFQINCYTWENREMDKMNVGRQVQ